MKPIIVLAKKKLHSYAISYWAKRHANVLQRHRRNVGWNHAKKIGVLYTDNAHNHTAVGRFVQSIRLQEKQVAVLCYVPAKKPISGPLAYLPTVTDSAVDLRGRVTDKKVYRFLSTQFDYLYHLDFCGSPILDYLLATSFAKCRIGYGRERDHLLDIIITSSNNHSTKNIDWLIKQVIHYIHI